MLCIFSHHLYSLYTGAQCEHIDVFCAKHFITTNADSCPICAAPLRWDQLAIDMTLDAFVASHPNALECDVNADGAVTRETSFFGEEGDEGEIVISLPNLAPATTAPAKKVFEVGLESDEEDEKRAVIEEKRIESKIGIKRYYVDVDQRKQLLDERQEQRKKQRLDKEAKKRLHVAVMKQQKRQQKRINHQKSRANEPILIE